MSKLSGLICVGFLLVSCAGNAPVEESSSSIAWCQEPPSCPPCYINGGWGGCSCVALKCPTGYRCDGGDQCVPITPPTCSPGTADCDGNTTNGCETWLNTLSNCGACGVTCPAAPAGGSAVCVDGKCYYACGTGQAPICQ